MAKDLTKAETDAHLFTKFLMKYHPDLMVQVPSPPAPLSPFFRLPLEIRRLVYHELWKSTPTVRGSTCTRNSYTSTRIRYEPVPFGEPKAGDIKKMPSWLLTNKAMLDEGLAQLCFKGEWVLSRFTQTQQKASPRTGVVPPSLARSLTMYITFTTSSIGHYRRAPLKLPANCPVRPTFDRNPMISLNQAGQTVWLEQIFDSLVRGNELKHLRLCLDVKFHLLGPIKTMDFPNFSNPSRVEINFSPLRMLKSISNLETLDIITEDFDAPNSDQSGQYSLYRELLAQGIDAEIRQLARHVMGKRLKEPVVRSAVLRLDRPAWKFNITRI